MLSGTSRYLSDLIHDKLNCKSRAIEFSTLQRCASHLASRTDVNEAYAVGGAAAAAAFAGETGRMIALKRISAYPYQSITESVDVQQVANLEKKVPLDWISPDGMQVTAAFEEYARPLILDEVTPVYVNGTPRHIYCRNRKTKKEKSSWVKMQSLVSLAVLLPSSMQALQAYLRAARTAAQRSFTVCAMALPVCWRSGWWIFPPC